MGTSLNSGVLTDKWQRLDATFLENRAKILIKKVGLFKIRGPRLIAPSHGGRKFITTLQSSEKAKGLVSGTESKITDRNVLVNLN